MGKKRVAALEKVDADLGNLQYKIRRDPKSYEEDFFRQWGNYWSQRDLFLTAPSSAPIEAARAFHDQLDLFAHVADCYPETTSCLPDDLRSILTRHHATLNPDLREKIVESLVLLRRKDIIDSRSLLTTLFPVLLEAPSKTLRSVIFQKIVSDLRNSNSKTTDHRLNRTVQNLLHSLATSDRSSAKALWAVKLTREMWKRQIWTDAKPVDVMKEACLSDNEKVVVGGCRFFLGGDKEREELEDESSDEESVNLKKMKHQMGINKKTKKKAKAFEKAIDKVKRAERKKKQPHPLNFSALHLLHDPQGFAEQLFSKHLQSTKARLTLEHRLLVLQLISRLVGLHKLTIIALYSWFIKYLTPKQQSVTSFLASLAMAAHTHVPPDALEPLVLRIANEFVSEASAGEVAAAGINAIREICVRQPLAMNDTLLQDLVAYKNSKDKGVMMAAKGLLSLYRDKNPELLRKKDRGKDASIGLKNGDLKQQKFGEEAEGGIEGIELLAKWKEEEKKRKVAENAAQNGSQAEDDHMRERGDEGEAGEEDNGFHSSDWDVASVDSSDSGGWINVSDSEDDEPSAKRQKTDAEAPESEQEDPELAAERAAKLVSTSILTPADWAKLQELRMEADVDKSMGQRGAKRQRDLQAAAAGRHVDDPLTAEQIELPAKLRKLTKEERVALAREGKPDRNEHKSTQAIRRAKKEAAGKSTTNREKARKKNLLMVLGKAKAKQKRSLVQTRKVLRGHVQRSKSGGRRRNGG